MPVYRKGRDHWQVVVHYKGRRKDREVHGSKADAEAYEARLRLQLEANDPTVDVRVVPTFSDFSTGRYAAHAEKHLKARTWSNRKYTLATLIEHFGPLKMNELGLLHLEHYQTARLKDGRRPSTINDEVKVFRAVRAYAKGIGIPVQDFVIRDIPERGKRRVTAWTRDQVQLLLASVAARSPAIYGLVLFLLNTGCRRGEGIALEWSSVDLRRRIVRVEPNEEWQPKDGEAREIPIDGPLLSWLSSMPRRGRWVFPARGGERYAFWPQLAFDRARKAAVPKEQAAVHAQQHGELAIEDCAECATHALKGGPHTTRHTYATHFLQRQPDLFLLARILGHADITVTRLYSHLLPDHLERARGAVAFSAPVDLNDIEQALAGGTGGTDADL
jgi:integrase